MTERMKIGVTNRPTQISRNIPTATVTWPTSRNSSVCRRSPTSAPSRQVWWSSVPTAVSTCGCPPRRPRWVSAISAVSSPAAAASAVTRMRPTCPPIRRWQKALPASAVSIWAATRPVTAAAAVSATTCPPPSPSHRVNREESGCVSHRRMPPWLARISTATIPPCRVSSSGEPTGTLPCSGLSTPAVRRSMR